MEDEALEPGPKAWAAPPNCCDRTRSGLCCNVVYDRHGVGENDGVRNDNVSPLFRGQDCCAGLNIRHVSLNARNTDEITQAKWLLQQQENPR